MVDGVKDDVDWFIRIVGHQFESSGFFVKLLQGNALVLIVQEVEDGRDEWHDLSGDEITKGGKVFGVYSFNDFLDYVSFEQ